MSEASSTILLLPAERSSGACSSDFWYRLRMEPTEEQFNALGNYRDIITQNASKVAEALGIFARNAYRMDRGQRRANERTSRQDFGVLKARKQSRVVKKLFYPFRLVLRAIDGELFDVHENGVPPSNCSNDFKSDHAFR